MITPPDNIENVLPSIFLAGPIQGAENWHKQAGNIIGELDPNINIACPRRPRNIDLPYNDQVEWEGHYLMRSAALGSILFWLADEKVHHPERAYAQTSRFELAEWLEKTSNLVIGIEPGFSGERYIRLRVRKDYPNIKIFNTLKDTCAGAVDIAQSKKI